MCNKVTQLSPWPHLPRNFAASSHLAPQASQDAALARQLQQQELALQHSSHSGTHAGSEHGSLSQAAGHAPYAATPPHRPQGGYMGSPYNPPGKAASSHAPDSGFSATPIAQGAQFGAAQASHPHRTGSQITSDEALARELQAQEQRQAHAQQQRQQQQRQQQHEHHAGDPRAQVRQDTSKKQGCAIS